MNYLAINIKGSNIDEVNAILLSIGIQTQLIIMGNQIQVDILDLKEDYLKTSEFLKKNGLKDDTAFFNDFDINPFGLKLSFYFTKKFKLLDLLEPVIFIVGQRISASLNTDCVVMFENNTVPIGLFSNGLLIETFDSYNLKYFENKVWRPRQI